MIKNHKFLVIACSVLLAMVSARAMQIAQDDPKPFTRARWVGPPGDLPSHIGVYRFRRQLELASVPRSFGVRISADSAFVLYVNGKRVGAGPAKSDLDHWKYEHFDLAPFLHSGSNTVLAMVWNFGFRAALSQMSFRTALLLETDDDSYKQLDTSRLWQVAQADDYQVESTDYAHLLRNYYAAGPGERIDGRLRGEGGLDDETTTSSGRSAYQAAFVIGSAYLRGARDAGTMWMLEPDALPAMEYSPISLGTVISNRGADIIDQSTMSLFVKPHTHAVLLLDQGTLTTAYPDLVLSRGRDANVRLTYAEALVDDHGHKGNRNAVQGYHIVGLSDELISDGAEKQRFPILEWRAWRFVQVDIQTENEPLQLDQAKAWFTAFPFKEQGEFSSSDPELKRIWDISWRTARLCAHDTYMDTPYWERLQYVGDTRLQALVSYAVAGDDRLAREAIDAIDNSRFSDGITQSRYPSSLPQVIPPFSLMWIGMVHDFWMYRNDSRYVKQHLPGTRAVLGWFLEYQRNDGMLGRLPWWNFVDWTKDFPNGVPPQDANGRSALITLQFIEALGYGIDLERDLGNEHIAQEYQAARDNAINAIVKLCWSPSSGLVADTPDQNHYSQQTNALAVWLDTLPRGQRTSVMKKTMEDPELSPASYYFRFYLARAMEASGFGNDYLAMLKPWREMLSLGLTTWAEKPEPTRSDSHAWSSHPAFDLLRIVAGIRPAVPGFHKVEIEPHLGSLKDIDAVYPHELGEIRISIHHKEAALSATINLPSPLSGTFIWEGRRYPLHGGSQTLTLK